MEQEPQTKDYDTYSAWAQAIYEYRLRQQVMPPDEPQPTRVPRRKTTTRKVTAKKTVTRKKKSIKATVTREKAKRNVVVSVTQDDWKKATAQWISYLRAGYGRIHYDTLFQSQIDFWVQAKKDPKKLSGEPVLVMADNQGNFYSSYPFPATILKVTERDGEIIMKCIFHPIEEQQWDGERIEDVRIFQILPPRPAPKATEEEKKELMSDRNQLKLVQLLTTINNNRNQEITQMKKNEQDYLRYIEDYGKKIMQYEKMIGETHQKLKNAVTDDISLSDLKSNLDQLASHKKVAWALIDINGELVAETTMLYYTERDSGKERKDTEIGRFAIIAYPNTGGINAKNLDYSANGYGHMNLNGTSLCLGGNQRNVTDMVKSGRFYDLIDFMTLFFSIFPHDAGDGGWIKYEDWLSSRRKSTYKNPWTPSSYLYKVEQQKDLDKKKRKQKKKALPGLLGKLQKLNEEEKSVTKATLIRTVVDIPHPTMDNTLLCEVCGRQDDTVSIQNCGYEEEINGTIVSEVICEECEQNHRDDI